MTNIKKICFTYLFLVVCFPVVTSAQLSEYSLKAVFLERFTRFIEWPEESVVSDTSKAFVLGVMGKNPFGSILEQLYATQKIKNKEVEIRYISNMDLILGCHLLFISKSEKNELIKILSVTKDKPILTISDEVGFAEKGVLINFYLSQERVRFEINETAFKVSGLKASYLLLDVAKIVNPVVVNDKN